MRKSFGTRRSAVPSQCQVLPPDLRSYVLLNSSGPPCT